MVEGIYDCCGRSRHRSSTVDGIGVDCGPYSFLFIYDAHSCELQQQLNGKQVWVEQTKIPSLFGGNLVVVHVVSGGNTYFEKSDAELREEWVKRSKTSAIWLAAELAFFVGFVWAALTVKPDGKLEK